VFLIGVVLPGLVERRFDSCVIGSIASTNRDRSDYYEQSHVIAETVTPLRLSNRVISVL